MGSVGSSVGGHQLCLVCCTMQISFILCVLIGTFLHPAPAEVVGNFWDSPDCLKFFYKNKVPELGSTQADVVLLCQRFLNTYHFATLYNTYYHIAVYSAYIFEPSNGGGRDKNWYLEPQVCCLSIVPSCLLLRHLRLCSTKESYTGFE